MRLTRSKKGQKKQPHTRVEAATRHSGGPICMAGQPDQRAAPGWGAALGWGCGGITPQAHMGRIPWGFGVERAAPGPAARKQKDLCGQTGVGRWASVPTSLGTEMTGLMLLAGDTAAGQLEAHAATLGHPVAHCHRDLRMPTHLPGRHMAMPPPP